MASIFAMASARSVPRARDEGSSVLRADGVPACAWGAGEGVAGMFDVVVDEETGAAGAAGVCEDLAAGAGVDGVAAG